MAVLTEYFVVLYAMDLGVTDATLLKTEWPVTIAISPLFHLVPISVIITLAFCWTYLTRKFAVKPQETRRGKVEVSSRREMEPRKTSRMGRATRRFFRKTRASLLRIEGISYLWQRIHFARATIKSALTVLLAFIMFVLIVSLLTYPQLIYRTIAGAYQSNPSLLNFVMSIDNALRGFAETVSPIGWISTSINNALLAAAPSIRDLGVGLGGLVKPLASLDGDGKYLVFQNAAAWISVLIILFYGEYIRKGHRYEKK